MDEYTPDSALLRQWCAFLMSKLLVNNLDGILQFWRNGYTTRILNITENIPEVRAALVQLLGSLLYIGGSGAGDEGELDNSDPVYSDAKLELAKQESKIVNYVVDKLRTDGAMIVRREVVCFYSRMAKKYKRFFKICAYNQLQEEIATVDTPSEIEDVRRKLRTYGTVYSSIWRSLLIFTADPHDEVRSYAMQVVDHVMFELNDDKVIGEVCVLMENYLTEKRSSGNTTAEEIAKRNPYLRPQVPITFQIVHF
ncbi:unnamed protein product [Ambrosiozyma monospora]|uniref:Unnamed protein product n=1 Tax=Ambrosiozyma monospora TaxID=43982 RepID=A0ACB5U2K5_AMBMO|nr:unnamed protein product [Ambrosiozyma monospora]